MVLSMKGRYGVAMTYGHILPGAARLSKITLPSKLVKQRLAWMDYYKKDGNARRTCRYFGIAPKTFYKWLERYESQGLRGLEDVSRKPKTFRVSKVPMEEVDVVIRLRKEYPMYSKYKISELLRREHGILLSASTVGRLFTKHKLFFPTPIPAKRQRNRQAAVKQRLHPYYRSTKPGELIEADMKHLSFFGAKKYLFVGIDCVTKRLAVHVATTSSSKQASHLLTKLSETFPYPVLQLRVDNGSENLKDFTKRATDLGMKEYFTRPRRPKDKPFVERVIGTIEREFIQQGHLAQDLEEQRRLVDEWVNHYNTFRPHQALNNLTPEAYERTLQETS